MKHAVVAEAVARLVAAARRSPRSASWSLKATRMPLPPPPALALIITGIADAARDLDRAARASSMAPF
jgi:hypothetical protein